MGKFLDTLLGKSDQSITHSPSSVKDSRLHKSDDSYVCYCTELEQALSSLETCLLTSSNPEGIAMQALRTACTFYGGDWAGILEVDLDFDIWAPVWWYNSYIPDRTTQLILEFESLDFMPRWIEAMQHGKNIVIPDVDIIKDQNPKEYAVYKRLLAQFLSCRSQRASWSSEIHLVILRGPVCSAHLPMCCNVLWLSRK